MNKTNKELAVNVAIAFINAGMIKTTEDAIVAIEKITLALDNDTDGTFAVQV